MAVTEDLEKLSLPKNPSSSEGTVGKDYLVSINKGTAAEPVWVLVGGQRNAALDMSADTVDTSHKTSGSWKSGSQGLKSWKIDFSGLSMLNDEGVSYVEACYRQGADANIKLEYPDGRYRTGWASVTSFSMDTPHDGVATLKSTFNGKGPISEMITPEKASIAPTSGSYSKAAAKDVTFSVTPTTETMRSVVNGGSTLVSGTDYTYSAGTLTILSTYLAKQSNGAVSLTVNTATNTFTLSITVAA